MAYRITCISKDGGNHENPYVAISFLNWVSEQSGQSGRTSRTDMHDFVAKGGEVYVQAGAARARLIAEVSSRGNKYVKTRADSTTADNLLTLPECR
jgi:hypothetical protein